MNLENKGEEMGVIVFLSFLVGVASAIYWMVVGWRAMRAHERIADAGENWLRTRREERLIARRKVEEPSPSHAEESEDKFTPLSDAPPEFPWAKEV